MTGREEKKWTTSETNVRRGGYNDNERYHIHVHTEDEELFIKIKNVLDEYYETNKDEMEETEEEA